LEVLKKADFNSGCPHWVNQYTLPF
jgi:hypothetical protein